MNVYCVKCWDGSRGLEKCSVVEVHLDYSFKTSYTETTLKHICHEVAFQKFSPNSLCSWMETQPVALCLSIRRHQRTSA